MDKETLLWVVDFLCERNFLKALLSWDNWSAWYKENEKDCNDHGILFYCGCDKFCIQVAGANHVIKVAMHDEYRKIDRCAIEEQLFEEAKLLHLEKYFARVELLTTREGINFYAQPLVRCDEDQIDSFFDDYLAEECDYHISNYECEEDYWDAINKAKEDMNSEDHIYAILGYTTDSRALADFFDKYDIADLHTGNWGFLNEEPVLIDYCGYETDNFYKEHFKCGKE